MGRVNGRLCFLHQIDLDEGDVLQSKVGLITSLEEFYSAVDTILQKAGVTRIELALKNFSLVGSKTYGVCPKSFPKTDLTFRLLSILNLCVGGQNGTDFINLPYSGSLFDQPNLLLEAYYVFVDEANKYFKEMLDDAPHKSRR